MLPFFGIHTDPSWVWEKNRKMMEDDSFRRIGWILLRWDWHWAFIAISSCLLSHQLSCSRRGIHIAILPMIEVSGLEATSPELTLINLPFLVKSGGCFLSLHLKYMVKSWGKTSALMASRSSSHERWWDSTDLNGFSDISYPQTSIHQLYVPCQLDRFKNWLHCDV